jgi:hypothetical protein
MTVEMDWDITVTIDVLAGGFTLGVNAQGLVVTVRRADRPDN